MLRLSLIVTSLTLFACTSKSDPASIERTLSEARSGLEFQSDEIQTLQKDDFGNPGLLWVDKGRTLWETDCSRCHGAIESMTSVATTYPKFNADNKRVINLNQRIELCRVKHSNLTPLEYESDERLALNAAITHQSIGQTFSVDISGKNADAFNRGREYFYTRRGQMNLACHHCHEINAGKKLRGETLSQGHSNGYPTYRLQWQTLGSLHRRLRFCNAALRAEPFDYGAQEYVDLELFLAWRAASLPLETPAVRR